MATLGDRMADLGGEVHDATPEEMLEAGLRPTGAQLFAAMTREQQDAALGPAVAAAVRDGRVRLGDLIRRVPTRAGDGGFITQATQADLGIGDATGGTDT